MTKVVFTENLKRHIDCPPIEVEASTVREALDQVFAVNQSLRSYILDDQARLRQHVMIAIDGDIIRDRINLSDRVDNHSEIFVLQALSGG